MASTSPDGEPVSADGALPASALAGLGDRPFGIYLHVPFCASRCGYCDFNTYTARELGGGASQAAYADTAAAELRLARRLLGDVELPVATVFFGGGTPTLLPADDLGRLLDVVRAEFGLTPDAEVSTEANPESLDDGYLPRLREHGITRLSLGMQSARAHVLAALDRRHTPGRPQGCVREAWAAGFEHVSLDLIYGAPGESDADWQASLDAALAAGPDHVSVYSLIVEDGTRLGRAVTAGELPAPDDDVLAERYLMADATLSEAGLAWYEVSNWGAPCRHNLGYWRSHDWWGVGPGAHSHIGGTRWWNVRHPSAYADLLAAGRSPAQAREVLNQPARQLERLMLAIRLAEGLPLAELSSAGLAGARQARDDGLLDLTAYDDGRAVLTLRGRLLADAVILRLTP